MFAIEIPSVKFSCFFLQFIIVFFFWKISVSCTVSLCFSYRGQSVLQPILRVHFKFLLIFKWLLWWEIRIISGATGSHCLLIYILIINFNFLFCLYFTHVHCIRKRMYLNLLLLTILKRQSHHNAIFKLTFTIWRKFNFITFNLNTVLILFIRFSFIFYLL